MFGFSDPESMKSEPVLTKKQKKVVDAYTKLIPEYARLSREVAALLRGLLHKSGIEYVDIMHRAKSIHSFRDKMLRTKYKSPMQGIRDLCGVRIICSFPAQVAKIDAMIKRNFNVATFIDLEQNTNPYKFWYRSHHFKVRLRDKQIRKDKYKLLTRFVAEIQVRTVFMDAWAKMDHEISYKQEWNTSDETKRKLSRLSALLELADEQLEELAKGK